LTPGVIRIPFSWDFPTIRPLATAPSPAIPSSPLTLVTDTAGDQVPGHSRVVVWGSYTRFNPPLARPGTTGSSTADPFWATQFTSAMLGNELAVWRAFLSLTTVLLLDTRRNATSAMPPVGSSFGPLSCCWHRA
jgi:hypothetical protein